MAVARPVHPPILSTLLARGRGFADDVANDLCRSSGALAPAGLPDKGTTALLRLWFVLAAALVGFLTASSVGGAVVTARSVVFRAAAEPRAGSLPEHGVRVLIVTPVVTAPSRAGVAVEAAVTAPAAARAWPRTASAPRHAGRPAEGGRRDSKSGGLLDAALR